MLDCFCLSTLLRVSLFILSISTEGSDTGSGKTTCFGLPFRMHKDIVSGVGKAAIKKINVPKDMLSEVKNHIVNTNKIMPENLYNLTFGHTIAVGVAFDPGSHFPESMGKAEIDSLFKIVADFMESEKKSEESITSFMSFVTKRMKALSEKAEDAKKKKAGKEASEAAAPANDTRSAFMRASAILESGGDIAEKMSNMNEFSAQTQHTIAQIIIHTTEFSLVLTAMLEAVIMNKGPAEKWASKAKALYESKNDEIKALMNLDCLELQFMSVHPVRLLVACIEQAFSEEKSPTLAEHDLVTEFGAIIMTEKDETPQKLSDRLSKENQKLPAEVQYDSLRLGTLMRSAMSKSTWSKARKCTEKFEEGRVTNSWDPKTMDLAFVTRMMTAYFPKGDKTAKSDDHAAAESDDGPSQLSGGAQKEVQREGKKGKVKGKGKGKGKGKANSASDGGGASGGGGGGGGWHSTCFVCHKPGHSYRSIRDNGTPFHTPEEIAAARAAEYERRSASGGESTSWTKGKGGKGGKGGGWHRSGGAAEIDDISKEELEYQLLQERAAATEARLKLFEARKDNNRGAAAPLSDGWN